MDRQGETAGERRTEDEWWHDLYEEGVPDTGPQRAGDTLDDRFASVARAVDEEADVPPAEADPPAPEPPSAAAAAEPRRASAEEPYDQMADPDYPPPSVAGVPGFEERPAPAGGRGWTDDVFAGLREDEGPSRRPPEDAKPRPERAVAPREPAPEPAEPAGAAEGAAPWWESAARGGPGEAPDGTASDAAAPREREPADGGAPAAPAPRGTVERTPGDGALPAAPDPAAPDPADTAPVGSWESGERSWVDGVLSGRREIADPEPVGSPAPAEPAPADAASPGQRGPEGPTATDAGAADSSATVGPAPADGEPAGSWESGERSWVDGVLSGRRGTAGREPVGSPEPAPAEAQLPGAREAADSAPPAAAPPRVRRPAEPAASAAPPGTAERAEPAPVDGPLPGSPGSARGTAPAEVLPPGPDEPPATEPGSGEAVPPVAARHAPIAPESPGFASAAPPPPASGRPSAPAPPAVTEPGSGEAVPPGVAQRGPVAPESPGPGPRPAAPAAPAEPAVAGPSETPPPTMRLRQVSVTDTLTDVEWARRGGEFVGGGPPTYEAEPTALPEVAPGALAELVPDTVLDGARYGSFTLRTAATRGDSPRYRGEQRRDAVLTARFGGGDDALVFVAVATGARGVPRTDRAAESLVRWMGEAVGRSRARLSEDIRTGRRAALKGGLHRLTGRTYGLMRAQAEEFGLDPAGYTAGLRCLLLSADPGCRTRVFFGTGPGGLFRLRGDEWQDLEPAPADEEPRQDGPRQGDPRQGESRQEPAAPVDPRLTVDLGGRSAHPAPAPGGPPPPGFGALVDTPDPGEPAPFAFRASEGRTGDVLLLCSPGFAEPLRGAPGLADELAERWRGEEAPPGLAAFLGDVQLRAKGFADDRTAAALWES
ncbi:protein phosphatase 2C domain-containing protein [Streptomyces aculeolatus]|uniref:protein phosphatase 2C domain-containing protein n=1 Tax=Streptomyces aculeolatus TaxID=270689 RepID=UPI001CED7F67|nr:protein phosphatase 2C domain-containing protein [Streptomyces aculeolatus]